MPGSLVVQQPRVQIVIRIGAWGAVFPFELFRSCFGSRFFSLKRARGRTWQADAVGSSLSLSIERGVSWADT